MLQQPLRRRAGRRLARRSGRRPGSEAGADAGDAAPPDSVAADAALDASPSDKPLPDVGADQASPDAAQPDVSAPDQSPPDISKGPDIPPTNCGDSNITGKEQCDGYNLGTATCKGKGHDGGDLACKWNCTLDLSGCYKLTQTVLATDKFNMVTRTAPAVAALGGEYLVAYARLSLPMAINQADIYGLRVTASGNPVGGAVPVSKSLSSEATPAVAASKSRYLVAWSDATGNIHGSRMTKTGTVEDASGISIGLSSQVQSVPSVASDGTDFLVAWQQQNTTSTSGVRAVLVNQWGKVPTAPGLLDLFWHAGKGSGSTPALASNKTGYISVNMHSYAKLLGDIEAVSVDFKGKVGTTPSTVYKTATKAATSAAPATASDGSNFLVVYRVGNHAGAYKIWGALMDGAGKLLVKSIAFASTGNQSNPAVAFDGKAYVVVWEDTRGGNVDIYGTRVSQAGKVLTPTGIPICTASKSQLLPAVASVGASTLVVWQDMRGGIVNGIYGAVLAP